MSNEKEKDKPQLKFVDFAEFKSTDEESGGFSGYANNFGILDSYDDITLPGCFKDSLTEFLNSGFTASDHRWGVANEIGFPIKAYEDSVGLFIESIYHPTPDAQAIRQKVNNRLKNGKKVSLSIGYRALKDGYDYVIGEEAAPFLINPSQEVLDYLKEKEPLVRLLKKVKLYEFSVVPVGANQESEVTEAKCAARTEYEALTKQVSNAKQIQILNLKLRAIPA